MLMDFCVCVFCVCVALYVPPVLAVVFCMPHMGLTTLNYSLIEISMWIQLFM